VVSQSVKARVRFLSAYLRVNDYLNHFASHGDFDQDRSERRQGRYLITVYVSNRMLHSGVPGDRGSDANLTFLSAICSIRKYNQIFSKPAASCLTSPQ